MNFLITGGAGFLGAALSNRLLRQGHHVRVLDDLSTGNPNALDPEVHFTRGDINDRPKLWTLLQDIDCVYHMAARVSVPESILFPRDYTAVNVVGTVNLMEAARDAGTPKVVLASSGAVYGEQKQPVLTEDLAPRPGSPYAVSKLSSEWYVRTIGALSGIQTLCLRIFNAMPMVRDSTSRRPILR
jgi:UDP-glucose 4-epimerase